MKSLSTLCRVVMPAVAVTVLGASAAWAKASPAQRTEALVAAFMEVKSSEDGDLSASDKAHNKKAFAALDAFFDYDTMTASTIAPHRKKFSDDQAAKFEGRLRELIRMVAYPDSGAFLREAKRKLGKTKDKGGNAEVTMNLFVEKEDLEMDVTFIWKDGSDWKLIDVAFDGARLTKDYQNQFGRIIGKGGVEDLLKKIEKRYTKELSERQ